MLFTFDPTFIFSDWKAEFTFIIMELKSDLGDAFSGAGKGVHFSLCKITELLGDGCLAF